MAARKSLALPVSDDANDLLTRDAFALLVGMVLDQQVPLERAFSAPLDLRERLGGRLTPEIVVETDPDELAGIFAGPPALHRFPAANAERVQKLARIVVDDYGGDAAAVWTSAKSGTDLLKKVKALPGFGEQKAKIFVALLGKQLGVRPTGWRTACAPYGEPRTTMSVADITSPKSLAAVREWKKAQKRKDG